VPLSWKSYVLLNGPGTGTSNCRSNLDELIERLSVMIPHLFEQTRHLFCLPRVPDFEVRANKGRSVSSCFMPSHSDARYGFIRSPSEMVARRPLEVLCLRNCESAFG
jgi:hypothetical protein